MGTLRAFLAGALAAGLSSAAVWGLWYVFQ
jgi:hypothetical protein